MLSENNKKNRSSDKIGFYPSLALVIGNMIGSGTFLLPALLIKNGSIGILGLVVAGLAATLLSVTFSRLSLIFKKSGGPYNYINEVYGNFMGYNACWFYWLAIWTGNLAIAIACSEYLEILIPVLGSNKIITVLTILWFFTLINCFNIYISGRVQLILTIIKVIPILLLMIVGFFYFNFNNLKPFIYKDFSITKSLLMPYFIAWWGFLGLESATVVSDNIEEQTKTIPQVTFWGTIIVSAIYLLIVIITVGGLSVLHLQKTSTPLADFSYLIIGNLGKFFISISAVLACFGAINGWTILQGQVPASAARDGNFPKIFKKEKKSGVPVFSIIISSLLATVLFFFINTRTTTKIFDIVASISIFSSLVVYLLCSLAEIIYSKNKFTNQLLLLSSSTALLIIISMLGIEFISIIITIVLAVLGMFFYPKNFNN